MNNDKIMVILSYIASSCLLLALQDSFRFLTAEAYDKSQCSIITSSPFAPKCCIKRLTSRTLTRGRR